MLFLRRFIFGIMICGTMFAAVGCQVSEPDYTVKVTSLQSIIDKAVSDVTVDLSSYNDITDWNASIDKALTIVGSSVAKDLDNATLSINVSGVSVSNVSNVNITIGSAVGTGSCTIKECSVNDMTVSGCGMLSGCLTLDGTTVGNVVFDRTVDNISGEYIGLWLKNQSVITKMTANAAVAVKTDANDIKRNEIETLEISSSTNKHQDACVAVLPNFYYNITNKNSIATVLFYDSRLEDNEIQARIDVMARQSDTKSVITRSFFSQSCKYLLGNVMDINIPASEFGAKVDADTSVDIPNMVDTVKVTFHNNLPDVTTDVKKVITNCAYTIPVIGFRSNDDMTFLYGWSDTPNGNKIYNLGDSAIFSKDTTLYAIWKPMYTISYRDRGISGDVTFDSWAAECYPKEYYVVDEAVELPADDMVNKDGYIFQGWYMDKDYSGVSINGWAANTKTGNQTLYAKWKYDVLLSNILIRSGDGEMTVKWVNPDNANLAKVNVILNGESYDVTADPGQPGQQKFTKNMTNGTMYTAILTAIDDKGNKSQIQTDNNYCGSYIGADGSIYIKGTKYDNTNMIAAISTSVDVTGDGDKGVFISGRTVTLSPYRIGKYEVTQQMYKAITEYNPSSHIGELYPVEQVSRSDCLEMCRKLNVLFGYEHTSTNDVTIDITKEGFRLPTEAEWEYAARGGNPSTAAWGYDYSGSNSIDGVCWYADNSGKQTHEVGSKSANTLGIYDMCGNVWEWVADGYSASIPSGVVTNPILNGSQYVQRGGGYGQNANWCSVYARTSDYNSQASKYCGFRLAINGAK